MEENNIQHVDCVDCFQLEILTLPNPSNNHTLIDYNKKNEGLPLQG